MFCAADLSCVRVRDRAICAVMASAAEAILKQVRAGLDATIPADFVRDKRAWRRENDGVCQRVRLDRMRNSLGLKWVTLSIYLDVHPCALSRDHGLIPRFLDSSSRHGRDDGFGLNFRFDDTPDVIARKAGTLCDAIPPCLDYLDRTFSQAGYLAEMTEGYYVRRLEVSLAFERRVDIETCLDRMDWAPRPELWSAGWYADLELAETVLLAYRFLNMKPAQRWLEMTSRTVGVINGKPSKEHAARYGRVRELLADELR
jgi:hypothetical protein